MHPSDGRERFCRQACFWGSHGTILNSTIMLAKGDGKHWLTWAKNQNYGHLKANQLWIWRNYVLFKGLMWITGKPNHHAPTWGFHQNSGSSNVVGLPWWHQKASNSPNDNQIIILHWLIICSIFCRGSRPPRSDRGTSETPVLGRSFAAPDRGDGKIW